MHLLLIGIFVTLAITAIIGFGWWVASNEHHRGETANAVAVAALSFLITAAFVALGLVQLATL